MKGLEKEIDESITCNVWSNADQKHSEMFLAQANGVRATDIKIFLSKRI
jgi:hypothetical protein